MSRPPRYAKRRDANEPEIVRALRAIGASVKQLDDTDLLVGYRRANFLLEVKNPATRYGQGKADNARGTQAKQKEWRESWRGQQAVVTSIDEAFAAIGVTARSA